MSSEMELMMERRQVLFGAAGLALVGSGAAWAVTRVPANAILPWKLLEQDIEDVRLDALRHAILAPNPHNRQPWLITLEGKDGVLLTCDLEKRLPETDPFDRQTLIGFGAFIELSRIAATKRGHSMTATFFPQGQPGERLDAKPVARLHFAPDPAIARDPLYASILLRRSTKLPFNDSRVPADASLAPLRSEGSAVHNTELISQIRPIIMSAIDLEMTIERTHLESVNLMRIGKDEVEANPDGIALTGGKIEFAKAMGMLDPKSMSDPDSTASKTARKQMQKVHASIPALLWITTPGNTRADQLEAGRRYVRANLIASVQGLALHPVSQSLQEYPEMAGRLTEVHRLLGAQGKERVQMLARLGYGPNVDPAPRWPLEKHLT